MMTQFILLQLLMSSGTLLLTDFSDKDLSSWSIVNDVVMGGRSDSGFYLNEEGQAVFKGYVSLENNGGFSMVKHIMEKKSVKNYKKIVVKLKGDGKRYQFRVKSSIRESHSYVQYFQTKEEWQIIELDLEEFYPTYRGRKLDSPNYPGESLEEIAILIGNKKAEDFELQIMWIALK